MKRYFSLVGNTEQGERLLQALAQPEKQHLSDLVKNPLRLMLLCRTWENEEEAGKLPDTQAQLYQGKRIVYGQRSR